MAACCERPQTSTPGPPCHPKMYSQSGAPVGVACNLPGPPARGESTASAQRRCRFHDRSSRSCQSRCFWNHCVNPNCPANVRCRGCCCCCGGWSHRCDWSHGRNCWRSCDGGSRLSFRACDSPCGPGPGQGPSTLRRQTRSPGRWRRNGRCLGPACSP